MILLEKGNRILGETVSSKINQVIPTTPAPAPSPAAKDKDKDAKDDVDEKVEPLDVKLCDFDDVSYRVVVAPENLKTMLVSMNLPCYAAIEKNGGKESFERFYGDIKTEAASGYDLTVKVNLDSFKDQKQKDDMVEKLSCLKSNVVSGVFDFYLSALLKGGAPMEPFKFSLRDDTIVFFFPKADKVIIIFSVDFKEKVDKAIARIFMQEFVEARRDKALGAAPPVNWSVNPPMELSHYKITEPTGNLGFISFAVAKSHVDNNKKERVINVLHAFRNYMQYHIKCSKAYFHSRMRARVASLLGVLSRAKFDPDSDTKKAQMKTASGRTFQRT